MDDIAALTHWLDDFANVISPESRRLLMRQLITGLRVRMRDRIKQQKDPEGIKFIPRKRDQIGKIRRSGPMFQRIGTRIKTKSTPDYAQIGFAGRDGLIATVHQDGLTQKPTKHSKPVRYPLRQLVGFSEDDIHWIETTTLDFMSSKL
ncbi:phage virion morphogenesis protein [Acinetobacter modestus]|uniref:phage virion morphogenesis protein n=1 Tax=Acinetobacter modestus TaxID=1776740 RepID=UPI003015D540